MTAAAAVVELYALRPWAVQSNLGDGYVWAGSDPTDITCLVDQVAIRWGRENWTEPGFSPATLTLDLTAGNLPGYYAPPLLMPGSWVTVWAIDPVDGTRRHRFTGKITDLDWEWAPLGAETPNEATGQLQAASVSAELGRATLAAVAKTTGDPEINVVGDMFSALRAQTSARYSYHFLTSATAEPIPGQGVWVVQDDRAAGWNVLSYLDTLVEHLAGWTFENVTDATINYGTVYWRSETYQQAVAKTALILDACDLLAEIGWTISAETVNRVQWTAPYAYPAVVTPQVWTNDDGYSSVDRVWWTAPSPVPGPGTVGGQVEAGDRTSELLQEGRYPRWVASGLQIATEDLAPALYSTLLGLNPAAIIEVTGLPVWPGTPGPIDYMRLEGWDERYAATPAGPVHDLTLFVQAGMTLVNVPPVGPTGYRWLDVPSVPALTWEHVDPAIVWTDVAINGLNPDGTLDTGD